MGIKELYDIYGKHPAVTTDSRKVPQGSLFFALKGVSFDGNRFASAALDSGAAYAVVDDPSVIPLAEEGRKYILVDDVLAALQDLAAYHRKKLGIPLIAITGTNGKTTTKELTAAVLAAKYRVHATAGNLNNHIGVPLTLLSMPSDTEIAVIEMGASAIGEIAVLCGIAAPDYGLITNIGRAHMEGFGTPDAIKSAKGELYDYLAASGGTAVVRRDDPVLAGMAAERKGLSTIGYDSSIACGVESNLAGKYNLYNIAAAMQLGGIFGVEEHDIVHAVAGYAPSGDRSRKVYTGRNTVIADCYNANPSSMAEAVANLIGESPSEPSGRSMPKAVILGDMLELGRWSEYEHEELLRSLLHEEIRYVYLSGENLTRAYATVSKELSGKVQIPEIRTFPDAESLSKYLAARPLRGFLVLVKGSRGMALERTLDYL